MYALLRQLLFQLPPEFSHNLSLQGLDLLARCGLSGLVSEPPVSNPCEVMGIKFPNPVGLAAGLDKNADHLAGLSALGFGFIEVGTVTPRPQAGNPKPRLFRLPQQQAIINRMGFNNLGVDHLVRQVEQANYDGVLGINIGKNKDTPLESAIDDYLLCLRAAYRYASYITVNMSSPNTPGLRDLQFGEPLRHLLSQLKTGQLQLHSEVGRYVPMVVKIAPDMADEDISNVAAALIEHDIDGVIATNTSIDHSAVLNLKHGQEAGGLSGTPLAAKSTHVIAALARELVGKLPIIGVGGIMNGMSGLEKIEAGASLLQIYSGFIYRGPSLIREVNQAILARDP